MMSVALHIVNDVLYAMWINHDIHFAWQAHYLRGCLGCLLLFRAL